MDRPARNTELDAIKYIWDILGQRSRKGAAVFGFLLVWNVT